MNYHPLVTLAARGCFLILMCGLLALGGCARTKDAQTLAVEKTKEAKDIEASTLQDAPCLIGLGAWSRMDDFDKRTATFALCVPDSERFGVGLTTGGAQP